MTKKMIAIIFGGQSSEHEISCISATTVIRQVDKELYDVTLIGITKEGQWLKVDSVEQIENGRWVETKTEAVLLPDAVEKCILIHEGTSYTKVRVDIVYPVMHGLYGEDGTMSAHGVRSESERTEQYRDFVRWHRSLMLAVGCWPVLWEWIRCTQRLLSITLEFVRQTLSW